MSADITQVTVHLNDPVDVYADTYDDYSCLVIGNVLLFATETSPELLEAIAQAATRLAGIRRQQMAPKAVA